MAIDRLTSAPLVRAAPARGPRTLAVLTAVLLTAGAGLAGYLHHAAVLDTGPVTAALPSPEVRVSALPASAAPAVAPARMARATPLPAAGTPQALRWPLWEFQLRQPIPPRDPPLTPPDWRILGAAMSGGQPSLIILRQGRSEPEYFRTGDKLPGGYVVGQITDEDVTLVDGDKAVLLSFIGTR